MHINVEPKFVTYFVVTALVFMLLFFAGTAPDVMKDGGTQWAKGPSWQIEAGSAGHGAGEHH